VRAPHRYLVTGGLGCLGAWTAAELARGGDDVTIFDLGSDTGRLDAIVDEEERARIQLVTGDITDLDRVSRVLEAREIDSVIHLAALQVPSCRADPPAGMRVNVVGTVNVFEAVRRHGLTTPIVYASSIGMFAPSDTSPSGRLLASADPHPQTHYGVTKLANEGLARVYALEHGVSSIALRPMTVYGVGRDQGLTSGPTKAILAAVMRRPFRLPFGGPTLYQFASDAARAFIAASRADVAGATAFNLHGVVADGATLLGVIDDAVPASRHLLECEPMDLPFPSDIEGGDADFLTRLPVTSLRDGVVATASMFENLLHRGRLDPVRYGFND
jgi:UDP-glucuronate 4-epimerase